MEITGKLVQLGEVTEGQSQNGEWRKATAIFETTDKYPKKVAVVFWDNNKKQMLSEIKRCKIGDEMVVKFDVASREFNGRWYTDCTAFAIEPSKGQATNNWKQQDDDPTDDLPW